MARAGRTRSAQARYLPPDETLTQYGDSSTSPSFHRRPDYDEDELSLIAGRLVAAEACAKVKWRGCFRQHQTCVVRYTTVATLTSKGFRVENTPTRLNVDHCSVWWEAAENGDWPAEVSELFESCFDIA